jgi:hypothetical protein
MAKDAATTARMRRVIVDVALDLDLVRVEAWDDTDRHYLGNAMGDDGKSLLRALTRKLNAAFPGKGVVLAVDGFKILNEQ